MTMDDIVKAEAENHDTIILLREGIFWKAYEKSAYAFCKFIKPFQVKKRYIKSANDEIVSIGFPMSSTQSILNGRAILLEEERKMIVSIDPIDNEGFLAWKKEQTLTAPAAIPIPIPSGRTGYSGGQGTTGCSSQEKDVINSIRTFNLESKTPLECMMFLSEVKKQLS